MRANLTRNVPFTPGLRGQRFFTQWFSLDAAANPGGFVASNAMTLRIQGSVGAASVRRAAAPARRLRTGIGVGARVRLPPWPPRTGAAS